MKHRNHTIGLLLIFSLLFLISGCKSDNSAAFRSIDGNWLYCYPDEDESIIKNQDAAWFDYNEHEAPEANSSGDYIAFRSTFPISPVESGLLMISNEMYYYIELYGDGKLLHKSGNKNKKRLYGSSLITLVNVPSGTREFTIIAKCLGYDRIHRPQLVSGSGKALLEQFIHNSFLQIVLSLLFLMLAIFSFGTYIVKRKDSTMKETLWFAVLNFLLGINTITASNLMILYSDTYFWLLVVDMSTYLLLPFAFLNFVKIFLLHESALLKKGTVILLYTLSGLAGYFYLSLFIYPNKYMLKIINAYSAIILLITVFISVEIIRSLINRNIKYRRIAWALILFSLSVILEYVKIPLGLPAFISNIPLLLIGYTFVIIILGSVLVQQFSEARAKLKLYTAQLEDMNRNLETKVHERTIQLEHEKEKSEMLLLNILPTKVAEELKETGRSEPEQFENVSVMFTDFSGFTEMSALMSPSQLIGTLNEIYSEFDRISERNGCVRIKTIGDAYLCVCGMPDAVNDHASRMVRNAWDILNYMKGFNTGRDIAWRIRIGIHSGKVVGGVVGITKFIYDVFGDTINTASRMESLGEPGIIHISDEVKRQVSGFQLSERGMVEVKGKGLMRTWFVSGLQ